MALLNCEFLLAATSWHLDLRNSPTVVPSGAQNSISVQA